MPICRHCSRFYQAGSDHDAVCPAARVFIPDWEEETQADYAPPIRKDPTVWSVVRAHLRKRFKRWRANRRIPHICTKWNREIEGKFEEDLAEQQADELGVDEMIVFKWNQLVWQEILMWNSLDEPVSKDDYLFICDRRGFSTKQRRYLEEMLEFMKLKDWKD